MRNVHCKKYKTLKWPRDSCIHEKADNFCKPYGGHNSCKLKTGKILNILKVGQFCNI